jgi:hypothetical protein
VSKAAYSFLSLLPISFLLVSCGTDLSPKPGQEAPMGRDDAKKYNFGKLLGDDFLLFGAPKRHTNAVDGPSARVNRFLWQATLEVVSFMPLASADATGGVIVTDWYSAPQTPNERIKVTVYITDSQLRADALRVNMFKQVRKGNDWVNVTPDSATSIDIENIILSQARRLKIKATES